MQEILTAVTYLVVWLICARVIEIESGLTKLLISLGAAIVENRVNRVFPNFRNIFFLLSC